MAPGILRLQLPIDMPGLGHVNCYALEDPSGITLVDPGMPGPKSWKQLLDRFTRAGFGLRHVHTVVVTHSHIDHFGASGRLRVETGARVVTERSFRTWWDPNDAGDVELDLRPEGESEPDGLPWDRVTPWGGAHPRPPLSVRLRYKVLRPVMKQWFATPSPSLRLHDGEPAHLGGREWTAVHTPGHTTDHLCLFDQAGGVLLSGDHVLPSITPHISGLDAGPDPLTDFVASLDKVANLEGVRTVLPAHGHPFTDLQGRVTDIQAHHRERLERLRGLLGSLGEASVEQLSQRLFRPRSWGSMAESETYAHLEHLRTVGVAVSTTGEHGLTFRLAGD